VIDSTTHRGVIVDGNELGLVGFDTRSGKLGSVVRVAIPVWYLAVDNHDGVVVASTLYDGLYVLRTATGQVTKFLPDLGFVGHLAVDERTGYVYTDSSNGGKLSVFIVDPVSGRLVRTLDASISAVSMAVDASVNRVCMLSDGSERLSLVTIDTRSQRVLKTVRIRVPFAGLVWHVAVDPVAHRLIFVDVYVVHVLDTRTGRQLAAYQLLQRSQFLDQGP
jgi:DNA-binding beta-propeller fold protein YncE